MICGFSVDPDQDFRGGFVKLFTCFLIRIYICVFDISLQLLIHEYSISGFSWGLMVGRGGPWYSFVRGICDRVGCYEFPFFKLLVWDYAQ